MHLTNRLLMGMLPKNELKHKMFRPDSLDSYPKLSKINPDVQPLACASSLKPTPGIFYDIIDISRVRHNNGWSSLAMKYNISSEELYFMKGNFY